MAQWMRLVFLGTISITHQTEESMSIESLLSDSNTVTMAPPNQPNWQAPTPTPLRNNDASIGSALGVGGSPDIVNPLRQPISESPPNVGATGQLVGAILNPSGLQTTGKLQVSEESSMIVAGMVEAFMHKEHLLAGEKTCLEDSIAQLSSDIVGTGKDAIDAIKGLMNGASVQPGVASQIGTTSQGGVMSAGIDAAMKLTSFVTVSTALVKNCVQGDALRMLNETAHHLIDMKYLGHRLVVSGVDIAHCLADSIISYEGHHYHRFGMDIGTTLRKILLSNSSHGSHLPEGVPEQEIIQETTEGMMDGFFIDGSSVEITDSVRPDVDIKMDLHRCVAGNQPFFKEIFLALWNVIAQFSTNGEQHGFQASGDGESPKWTGELMIVLMQLPSALARCNIDAETQTMLLESIQTLGQVHMDFDFPRGKPSLKEISERAAGAVNEWTNWNFRNFGKELGVMLRELVLIVYPVKYSVDQNGRLQRQLSRSWASNVYSHGGTPEFLILFVVVSLMALIGLAGMRKMRPSSSEPFVVEDLEIVDGQLLSDELIE